jgi:sugar phosphate permease
MSGTLFLVVGLPLCFGVRRSPESMGMQPDGEPLQNAKNLDGGATRQTEPHNELHITTRQAMRTRIFWMLVVSMMARSAAFTTVTTHFIPIMVWKGLSQTQASVLLAGFAIFNLPLHFVLGWIGDFVNKPKLTAICMLLGIVALLPMLWTNSPWALWFFTALYCVLDASIPVYWASVGDFFGRKSFGTIRGTMNLFYTWGSILGPVIAGAVYDRTHSYATVMTGMTVLLIIAALFTATLINPWAATQDRLREVAVTAAT